MAKLTPLNLANLDNPTAAVSVINANFARVAEAIENTLSRDGTTPNSMTEELDMNSKPIINLRPPQEDTEPARHGDIQTYVDQAEDAQLAAEVAQGLAEDAQEAAEEAQEAAEEAQAGAEAAEAAAVSLVESAQDVLEEVESYVSLGFYDIGFFISALTEDGETCFRYVFPRDAHINSGAAGVAEGGVASTGTPVYSLKKNGVEFGTVTFTTSATGVVAVPSQTSFVTGDELTIIAPATADTTLVDVGITLKFVRD